VQKGKRFPFNLLRALYDWVLSFADRPSGVWALLLIAFAESSFFPIPPDVLLIALSIGAPMLSWWFALVCSIGSVAGAAVGYLIGLEFYSLIGQPIIEFYSAGDRYEQVEALYDQWDAVAVGVAGFTPIPFKVFTISAGAFQVHFWTFLAAAAVSRSARFFLVAGLIRWFGPGIRDLIDRYFNFLTILFTILLIGGFAVLKYVI
jgi:membrane protein YqaA with SNARE-associated domain